jgi:hypothetical protein
MIGINPRMRTDSGNLSAKKTTIRRRQRSISREDDKKTDVMRII